MAFAWRYTWVNLSMFRFLFKCAIFWIMVVSDTVHFCVASSAVPLIKVLDLNCPCRNANVLKLLAVEAGQGIGVEIWSVAPSK